MRMIATGHKNQVADHQRIVITGIGLTAPNGNSWKEFRESLLAGRSGVSKYDIRYVGETLAGVCSDSVKRSFASQNIDLATIKGWGNRAARGDLVAKAMTSIEVPDLLASQISAGCSKTLA